MLMTSLSGFFDKLPYLWADLNKIWLLLQLQESRQIHGRLAPCLLSVLSLENPNHWTALHKQRNNTLVLFRALMFRIGNVATNASFVTHEF
jgi:hypothetical protein